MSQAAATLCDPWGIWDTRDNCWAHTKLGTEDAARRGAANANSTLNPWSCGSRYEPRPFVETSP